MSDTRKYRSYEEILESMLKQMAGGPVRKTRLMYSGYINYDQLKNYMATLLSNGLMQIDEQGMYCLTPLGFKWLELREQMKALIA